LSTLGINVSVTRVIVFCISAFLAGIAGGLFGALNESVSTAGFDSFTSLLLLPVLFLAGTNQLTSPFVAAFALAVTPVYFTGKWFTDYQPVIFGAAAVLAAIGSTGRFDSTDKLLNLADRRQPLLLRHPIIDEREARLDRESQLRQQRVPASISAPDS
jgi:branched-subunit amino acid ABC-type transport system permease component